MTGSHKEQHSPTLASKAQLESATMPGSRSSLPELLAPAGDWDCARAAVENGADAIYFGLEKFNARMRAHNFTEADLPQLMEFLHARGVKGYATFNTLVFENELAQAEQCLKTIISAGVDAAIVQDVGICRLIRRLSPNFPIHVSTQMTITSSAGMAFARQLGCNLVVLARECSLKEIAQMVSTHSEVRVPQSAVGPPLPIEVFVHGALCVAYSGQCLTSEALGGRSANRGECAQACRLPYELIADGKPVELGGRRYLLSPQDLAGLEVLPELVRMGVTSLKIEGRLKSPEYVANITRIYRSALDKLSAHSRHSCPVTRHSTVQYELEMAFSRGLYTGWFGGTNNQALVHGRFGKKRGVYLGKVLSVERKGIVVGLEGPLKAGDGVVFDAGNPEQPEQGGRVYSLTIKNRFQGIPNPLRKASPGHIAASLCANSDLLHTDRAPDNAFLLEFGSGDIEPKRVQPGDRVWKTSDPELDRRIRQTFAGNTPRFARPVSIDVHGEAGQALIVLARDELGHIARVQSTMPLVRAEKHLLTTERLREHLARLGGTPFRLETLNNFLVGELLLPISELNRLRRALVADLLAQRAKPPKWTLECGVRNAECGTENVPESIQEHRAQRAEHGGRRTEHAETNPDFTLIALVRNLNQLEAALQNGVRTVYCDFDDPKKYHEAVARVRSFRSTGGHAEVFVAPPRIFKTGEDWMLKLVRSCGADGYLIRNYDHLEFFADDRCIGDYSLNIANCWSADYFKNACRLERITASYDLNSVQLDALLQSAPPAWFEVTIHQHMPMFHMEHCVFCAFLSRGTDYTNCGRPCDKHDVKLRDRVGAEHPVKADVGCRNTVFNSRAQTGAQHVLRLKELGLRHFRLEFLNETPAEVVRSLSLYRALLDGKIAAPEVWKELKLINQLGVTRGPAA